MMVPLPLAEVLTGGTSLAPDSATFTSAASAEPTPSPTSNMDATRIRTPKGNLAFRIIASSCWINERQAPRANLAWRHVRVRYAIAQTPAVASQRVLLRNAGKSARD